ncbi:MAG TPA: PQQ-binding-like beta-propeller repeat protein [Candidatus Lokiarchaeia archaeon]|nr:PQQ-binding-like beta-propeller repeat protein [Candidatus Lokiarchaeia archaeon]
MIVGVIGIAAGALVFLTRQENSTQSPIQGSITFVPATPLLATKTGSSDPSTDEWPMFRGQLNHTGTTITSTVRGSAPFWSHATGGEIESSPAIVGGRVYVGSDDNNTYCLNATTSAKLWNYTTGDIVFSSPAIADGRVYVGSDDHNVYCLNATTGTRIWKYTTGDWVDSSPVVSGGRVYIGSDDNNTYCLDAVSGSRYWKYTTGDWVDSSPAVLGGHVYVGSNDGKVYCLDATSGSKTWSYPTGGSVECSPAIAYNRVYIGSDDNYTYCLNATTGAKMWSYKTGGLVESSPAIAGGYVFVGSWNGTIFCLNATTGAKAWSFAAHAVVFSSPAISSGHLFIGCDDTNVYCLNATTGKRLWNYTTGDWVDSSPAIANGRVYVGSDDAKLYCLPMDLIYRPSAPQNLQASVGNGQITLAWQAPANDGGSAVTNFTIYQGIMPGSESSIASTNDTTYTSTGMVNGKTYYFKVSAVNWAGEGPRTTEVQATPATIPGPPLEFTATASNGHISLSWQVPANNNGSAITGYKIYRGTSPGAETILVFLVNITAYVDTSTSSGRGYYYQVSAVNGAGEGYRSIEISATVDTVSSSFGIVLVMVGIAAGTTIVSIVFFRRYKIRNRQLKQTNPY